MPYQPTPRKIELERRLDEVRQNLKEIGVPLIVGQGFRGFAGRCVRLRYAYSERGYGANGYVVTVDDIRRENGKTQYRRTESVKYFSDTVFVPEQTNMTLGQGAYCVLPNPADLLDLAQQLLTRPAFPNGWQEL